MYISLRLHFDALSISCAMTDTRAASAATPANLDCIARSGPGLNVSIRSGTPKSKAARNAKPLEMSPEKMAIHDANHLLIATTEVFGAVKMMLLVRLVRFSYLHGHAYLAAAPKSSAAFLLR